MAGSCVRGSWRTSCAHLCIASQRTPDAAAANRTQRSALASVLDSRFSFLFWFRFSPIGAYRTVLADSAFLFCRRIVARSNRHHIALYVAKTNRARNSLVFFFANGTGNRGRCSRAFVFQYCSNHSLHACRSQNAPIFP